LTHNGFEWVRIHHERVDPFPDFSTLLDAVGDLATRASWRLRGVECFGEGASVLEGWSDDESEVSGPTLAATASKLSQVVEGYFLASDEQGRDALTIHAIDGTAWLIGSDVESLIEGLANVFPGTEKLGPGNKMDPFD